MPTFHIQNHTHTIASTLREILEEMYPHEYVACTVMHPLDTHLVVDAPSKAAIRTALMVIKDRISTARADVTTPS